MSTKILVIDDEINIAETLADILQLKGFEVMTASNGEIGYTKAVEEKPDLILCDVMMPEMDGYEVLQAIRKHENTRQIPFVFLTAKDNQHDFRHGMDIGADDYLTKPVEMETLFHTILSRLDKHRQLLKKGRSEENERIHRELHDTLQQTLLGLQMKLSRFREKAANAIDTTEIDESLGYVRLAFAQFRLILEDGYTTGDTGFVECLQRTISRISGYVDFEISLHNELTTEISRHQSEILFSVLLEILNNAIKHSGANKLFIHLTGEHPLVNLVILDDGRGFDPQKVNLGNGLKNIQERIKELNGQLAIDSSPGNGMSIEITFEI